MARPARSRGLLLVPGGAEDQGQRHSFALRLGLARCRAQFAVWRWAHDRSAARRRGAGRLGPRVLVRSLHRHALVRTRCARGVNRAETPFPQLGYARAATCRPARRSQGNGMTAQMERTERRPGQAVIQGKLAIPPLADWRVERPRLDRSLAALIERHRLVVVSATAGAGKTTA